MKLKVDFHAHTNKSIDALSTLNEMLAEAKKKGIDAIAITDHNICQLGEEHKEKDIMLIAGCEISTTEGHIVGVFLKKIIDIDGLWKGKLPSAEEAVTAIHDQGGIAILAHPFAGKKTVSKSHLAGIVDGIETVNARACFKNIQANHKAEEFAKEHGLTIIGGSDAHSKKEVGNAYTLVECKDKTVKSIEEAVRASYTQAILEKHTPHYRKGISQFHKTMRSQKKIYVFKGLLYLIYCLGLDLRDILHKLCT